MASQEGRRISAPLAFRVGDDASASQIAEAVIVMWHEIDDALTPVLGARGLVALYRRTLHLTAATCPGVASGAEGLLHATEPTALKALLVRQSATDAAILGSAFLSEFNGLVASLIGPSLTGRLLRAVWLPPSSGLTAQDNFP